MIYALKTVEQRTPTAFTSFLLSCIISPKYSLNKDMMHCIMDKTIQIRGVESRARKQQRSFQVSVCGNENLLTHAALQIFVIA